jgi:hypothetical protein
MPDIRHLIGIAAPVERIVALVGTPAGLAAWWAEDTRTTPDGEALLSFFGGATTYQLRLLSPDGERVEWECTTGGEWQGTRLLFRIEPGQGQVFLRFTHAGWRNETEYFTMCTTTWGALMARIKRVAEGGRPAPYFLRNGLDL